MLSFLASVLRCLLGIRPRKAVDRAKGILMTRKELPESDAFRMLQKMSRDKCQTMKQTAQDIIKASEIL